MDTLKIFCCYAQEDKGLMERFHAHLRCIVELEHVSIEYPHDILPGVEWTSELNRRLYSAHIIVFLVSSDFMSLLHEHYEKEVLPVIERHRRGETRVIPIILRPVHWKETPLGKLLPLPDNGKPVTDSLHWHTPDHAFVNIVTGLQRTINDVKTRLSGQQENCAITTHSPGESALTSHDASTQLEQIIQSFKLLREQIASFARLKKTKGVHLEDWESQYNKLYGDTMVFLATYLPECISNNSEGFVEIAYRKTTEQLLKRGDLYVSFPRQILSPLANFEKLADQIDAYRATLEFYMQKYFNGVHLDRTNLPSKPTNIRVTYQPSRDGNKGTIIFDLNGTEHTLEYLRRDNITHQIFSLKRKQQELVRLLIPPATIKPLEKQVEFQIDGVNGLFAFKMTAITSIMSIKVEIAGEEIFRT